MGASFRIFYPPEAQASGEPERELAVAESEGRFEKETWRMRKDGTQYWASETIVRLGGEKRELLGFAQICRDLSERRLADEERARLLKAEQEARASAEAANAAKDRFLAALSHELRTPLTPIAMAAYSLEQEKKLSATGRMAVEMIQRNLQNETQIIDDLLDVSRRLHGKLDLRLVPTDAHDCLRSALEVAEPDFAAKNLRLTISLQAKRRQVSADPTRLRQVFWNLLKNAAKFTGPDGWVEVRSRNALSGRLLIEVADGGIGIEADSLEKIFNPFEQGGSGRARQLGGLGLGLSIAHNITEAHGGRLSAWSGGPILGSTFQVELPTLGKTREKSAASENGGDE